MTSVEDYIEEKQIAEPKDDDIEIKQESIAILASLGTTKEYLGDEMSLGDIKKLTAKEVEKYYNRYQTVLGKKISGGLVDSALQLVSQVISYLVDVDDIEALCEDLKNDELVNRELSNFAGLSVLRGGRFVALASGLFQVAKHIRINKIQEISSTNEQATEHN